MPQRKCFITNRADDSLKEKRLFLCLLLGYHITRKNDLPNKFPSKLLLNALEDYKQDILPSDTKDHMHTAIIYLVQNNAFQMKFDWLVVFTIAAEVDPNYEFIERLRALKYSENLLAKFIKEAEMIRPYIDGIEFETYVKLAKVNFKYKTFSKFYMIFKEKFKIFVVVNPIMP